MIKPECREFISQIMKGTKSALSAKFYRSVPSVLSAILDKPMLFAAMLDSPLASYIPDTLHTGARDFCVDVLNSFVDGHLQNMLA
jgi:hypothetical protein